MAVGGPTASRRVALQRRCDAVEERQRQSDRRPWRPLQAAVMEPPPTHSVFVPSTRAVKMRKSVYEHLVTEFTEFFCDFNLSLRGG